LATGSAGRILVLVGLALFVFSVVGAIAARRSGRLERLSSWAFVGGSATIFCAMAALATLFVRDQFGFKYVFDRAAHDTSLQYKIAGIWAGQEGSFLLWACCAALFGLVALPFTGVYRRWFVFAYSLFLAALCGILAYESPFNLGFVENGVPLLPPTGVGLTPALQNYWVVIHPPTIFLGFGALTVMFAWAVSALILRQYDQWAVMVRPWAILALTLVGLGLCMGGFWAYETLGWGGFWAWDPVENTSFVPWCITAILIHGLIVQVTKGKWKATNLLMAGLPFLAFVYGTFLTRSGLLGDTSVHSFAQMDRSALQILVGLMASGYIGFLGLWLFRLKDVKATQQSADEGSLHREGVYRIASLLIAFLAVSTAVGMSVPLFMALAGTGAKRVEEALYHQVLAWPFVPIMILLAAGPFISWRSMSASELLNRLFNILCISIGFTGVSAWFISHPSLGVGLERGSTIPFFGGYEAPVLPWMLFLIWLCVFASFANGWRALELARRSPMSIGGYLSHFGLAMLMAGLIISRGFERSERVFVQEGDPGRGLGYVVAYKDRTSEEMMDRNNKIRFDVVGPSGERFVAQPTQFYTRTNDGLGQMTWPHIQRRLTHDVYFALAREVIEVGEAQTIKPGETKQIDERLSITFEELTREGEAGTVGVRFGALLHIDHDGRHHTANPGLTITEAGLEPSLEPVGEHFLISMHAMDAGSQSVTVQLYFNKPVYPIEIFYKPMTGLVWLGTGILTFGGFLAAWQRRGSRRKGGPGERALVEPKLEPQPKEEDALEPVAQS
jgi:cytochrome c-type biogenesis protein CcmF